MKARLGLFVGVLSTALLAASGASANAILSGTTTADNAFFAYVSSSNLTLGTLIGSGNSWPSSFPVTSASLLPGTYYLQIEAINYGGPAGLSGIFNLSGSGQFLNGTQTLTTDPANIPFWLGGYNDSSGAVAPQPWVVPSAAVYQDTNYPWGNVVGTSNWIWSSDSLSNPGGIPCGTCTVDFSAQFTVTGSTTVPEPSSLAMLLAGLAAIGGALYLGRKKTRRAQV